MSDTYILTIALDLSYICCFLLLSENNDVEVSTVGRSQDDAFKFITAMKEIVNNEKVDLRKILEIECLLSSAFRGYGYLVKRARANFIWDKETSDKQKESQGDIDKKESPKIVCISEYYVQELGGLLFPFFGVQKKTWRVYAD